MQHSHKVPSRSPCRRGRALRALLVAAIIGLGLARPAPAQDLDFNSLGALAREQILALIAEKEARTPVQQKIDSRLLLSIDAQRPQARYPILHSIARPEPKSDGRLTVDIDLFDGNRMGEVVSALKAVGAEVLFVSAPFRSIRARANPLELEAIAAAPNVRFIDSEREGDNGKSTTSEGDVTHKANLARSTLGYTGNGQKICVLSDGINTVPQRQATGDLPALIEALPG